MFSDNKGVWSDLKNILIVLIAGIVLFFLSTTVLHAGEKASDIESCKNWAVLQSSVKVPGVDVKLKDFENPCVTLKDELKGNKFERYNTLANSMYDVWKMYGQGKLDFYSDWDWGKKNTYCLIGDEIEVTDDIKDYSVNIDEFEEYLSDNNVPKSEFTYAEFLTNAKKTELDFGSGNIDLKKGDKIYIIFTVIKKSEGLTLTEGSVIGVGSCAIGGIAGAKIGTIIGGIIGLGAGSLATAPTGGVIGAGTGCLIGVLGTGISYAVGHSDELYPGIILITGENIPSLEKKCDGGLHYNPK